MRVRFDAFTFDSETRQLCRGGEPVPISPRVFALLELLLEHRPHPVPKQLIQDRLWPDTFVSEAGLASVISEARLAIGQTGATTGAIQNVQGHAYSFAVAVETVPFGGRSPSRFRLVLDGRDLTLYEGDNVLGRDPLNSVPIDASSVSRRHACIVVSGASARLEDLGSKNGTFVNGRRALDRVVLEDGDTIHMGRISLTFRSFSSGSSDGGLDEAARGSRRPG